MEQVKYILRESGDEVVSPAAMAQAIKKRFKWILLLAIVASGASAIITFNISDRFTSKAVVTSALFKKNELIPILDVASFGVQRKTPLAVAEMLDITPEEAATILKIETTDIQDDGSKNYIFSMSVTTTDTASIKNVYAGLLRFMGTNPYLNRRYKDREAQLDTLILKIEQQIADLYHFKNETRNLVKASQQGIVVYPINIHSEIILMEERLLNLKDQYNNLSLIQYIQEPIAPENASGPNRLMIILVTFLLSFGGGVFIIVGWELFKK